MEITIQTFDEKVSSELKKACGGVPEFYLYLVENPPLWLTLLLAGGLLMALVQKPYMMGYYKNTFHFIPTSAFTTTRMRTEQAFKISKSEIVNVKYKKFLFANYFTLTLKNGKKMRLVANTLYRKLSKQGEAIEKLKGLIVSSK